MNTGPHRTLSVRHDDFAERFAVIPDLRYMNGNGDLALIRGKVYYGETVIARRINPERVDVSAVNKKGGVNRVRSRIIRALEAEGYRRGRCSVEFDRYEK